MKKLSKADEIRRDKIYKELNEKHQKLINAIEEVNIAIERANQARDEYNESINDAIGFVDDMVAVMDDYIGERSENWPDTENGSLYIEWHDTYENFNVAEVEEISLIEDPTNDVADALIDLPSAPS